MSQEGRLGLDGGMERNGGPPVCGRSGDCVRASVWTAGVAAGAWRPLRGGGRSGFRAPRSVGRRGKSEPDTFHWRLCLGRDAIGFVQLTEEIAHKAGTAAGTQLLGRGEGKHIPPRFRTASNPSPGPPWPREGDPGRSSSGACGGGGGRGRGECSNLDPLGTPCDVPTFKGTRRETNETWRRGATTDHSPPPVCASRTGCCRRVCRFSEWGNLFCHSASRACWRRGGCPFAA